MRDSLCGNLQTWEKTKRLKILTLLQSKSSQASLINRMNPRSNAKVPPALKTHPSPLLSGLRQDPPKKAVCVRNLPKDATSQQRMHTSHIHTSPTTHIPHTHTNTNAIHTQQRHMHTNRTFLRHALATNTTNAHVYFLVESLFSDIGPIRHCYVITQRGSTVCTGTGFVHL